jgi:hypothetical protein
MGRSHGALLESMTPRICMSLILGLPEPMTGLSLVAILPQMESTKGMCSSKFYRSGVR